MASGATHAPSLRRDGSNDVSYEGARGGEGLVPYEERLGVGEKRHETRRRTFFAVRTMAVHAAAGSK